MIDIDAEINTGSVRMEIAHEGLGFFVDSAFFGSAFFGSALIQS
jgi:hypothetical protein